MKILVFTSLYPNNIWPNHGVFVKERMSEFARMTGCEVKVVAPVPYYPPIRLGWRAAYSQVVREEIIEGIRVYHPRYFMIPKIGMALQGLTMFLSLVWFVRKIRRHFDFDVIDAHYVYPDGFAALLLGRYFGTRVVVSARGSDINLFSRFPLVRRLLLYTLHRADKIIGVCQALKKAMMRLEVPEDKIVVVPNGVDHKKFHPIPKQTARRKLGLPLNHRILLSVGGLVPRKGFDVVIKALKIAIEDFGRNDLFLVIVGEGSQRTQLENLIELSGLEDRVLLVGTIPHEELYVWYSAADLFCLASSREGWPNVLLESLACGTPVVATEVWGIPEIIRREDIGLLSEREPAIMASRIREAIQKDWDGEAIRRYAATFTWSATAARVHEVFNLVLSNRESCD